MAGHPPLIPWKVVVLDTKCLFCKIIQRTIPSTIIQENEHVLVIQDIAPKAPIHYLILPKKHTENLTTLEVTDERYTNAMLTMAQKLGNALPSKAFNIVINNGAAAGQSVFHLHMHFLAGKNLFQSELGL